MAWLFFIRNSHLVVETCCRTCAKPRWCVRHLRFPPLAVLWLMYAFSFFTTTWATECPALFPVCRADGNCVASSCRGSACPRSCIFATSNACTGDYQVSPVGLSAARILKATEPTAANSTTTNMTEVLALSNTTTTRATVTATTVPDMFVEGNMTMEASDAAELLIEPLLQSILTTAIAALFNAHAGWIKIATCYQLLSRHGLLSIRRLSVVEVTRRLQSRKLHAIGQVGVSWTLELPPGTTHASATVLVEDFDDLSVSEVTQTVQALLDNETLNYTVNITWKYAIAKEHQRGIGTVSTTYIGGIGTVSTSSTSNASTTIDLSALWPFMMPMPPQPAASGNVGSVSEGTSSAGVIIVIVIFLIIAMAGIGAAGWFYRQPLWNGLQSLSLTALWDGMKTLQTDADLVPERNPAKTKEEFLRKAGEYATWSARDLMMPPHVVSRMRGDQIRQLVRAMYEERKLDAKVHVSFTPGPRSQDARGYGPGTFFAAAFIRALHDAGVPCFSELALPAHAKARQAFNSRLRARDTTCKVLVVLQTDELYKCRLCLRDLYVAQQSRMHIVPLRFEKDMPTEKMPWPHVTYNDQDDMIMTASVSRHFCALNAIPCPPHTVPEQPDVLDHVIQDLKVQLGEAGAVPSQARKAGGLEDISPLQQGARGSPDPLPTEHSGMMYGKPFSESHPPEPSRSEQQPLLPQRNVEEHVGNGGSTMPPQQEALPRRSSSEGSTPALKRPKSRPRKHVKPVVGSLSEAAPSPPRQPAMTPGAPPTHNSSNISASPSHKSRRHKGACKSVPVIAKTSTDKPVVRKRPKTVQNELVPPRAVPTVTSIGSSTGAAPTQAASPVRRARKQCTVPGASPSTAGQKRIKKKIGGDNPEGTGSVETFKPAPTLASTPSKSASTGKPAGSPTRRRKPMPVVPCRTHGTG